MHARKACYISRWRKSLSKADLKKKIKRRKHNGRVTIIFWGNIKTFEENKYYLLALKSSLRLFIEKEDNNISRREMELVVSKELMM